MSVSSTRRLAAIMFTDIVGYTALGQTDEFLSLAMLDENRKMLRPTFTDHNGREIKTIGDAFLVEFSSALDAARCAYDIQRKSREFNLTLSREKRIALRIGIHVGDVVENSEGDILGDAVNIASRIQSLAQDGGVCLTQQVYDQLANKFELPLVSIGKKALKNVDTSREIYRFVLPWENNQDALKDSRKNRIAVLPFSSLSPDPRDEYFADGITEEMITTISKIEGLEIISRTSVMQYKRAPKSIREVSRELEVGAVLEGSVRKAGNKLRITVQMIDAERDRHMWVESYDRELQDVFAIQIDIARKVAEALQAKMPKSGYGGGESTPGKLEAYTIYLRAMQLFNESTEPSLREAIALLEQAVSTDKSFARSYAALAHAWGRMAANGYEDFTVAIRKAEIAARRALVLEPDLAEAHAALADALGYADNYRESITECEKAIQISPSLSEAYISLGINHGALGDIDQSRTDLEKAHELDPLSLRAAVTLAQVNLVLGKVAEALEILQRIKERNLRNARIYAALADCYMMRREYSKAQEMLDDCFQINPTEPWGMVGQGLLYVFCSKTKDAEDILQKILKDEREFVRLNGQLYIQAALGNIDEAFKALMRAAETHSWPFLIKTLPVFEGLRNDPRFLEFCKKLGL